MEKIKKVLLNKSNITPLVFQTSRYAASNALKTAELTKLFTSLLSVGIWKSATDAAKEGVPAGTYIIVDDPKTPEQDFTVQVVPLIKK